MKTLLLCALAVAISCTIAVSSPRAGDETIEGEVICLGCTLKKADGAKAQCSVYGHKNAIKTGDGGILTILENDQSTKLINDHDYAGKKVEIQGRVFPEANVIQVDSFTVPPESKAGADTQ